MAAHDTATMTTLPELRTKTHTVPIPKRYEETKPVIVQGFTHQRILDIGSELHHKTQQQCRYDIDVAVQEAEVAFRARADTEKQEALEKQALKAKKDQEKANAKLERVHQRRVKEECSRVKTEMKELAKRQIKEEKAAGDKRQREAVLETEALWKVNMAEAVAAARREEQQMAEERAKIQAQEARDFLEAALKKAGEDKNRALEDLEALKNLEKAEAIKKTIQEQQVITAQKLDSQKRLYDQQIDVLHTYLRANQKEITDRQSELVKLLLAKKQVEDELVEMRGEFQTFINQVRPYQPVLPVDYVLPPLRSVNISDRA